jgi:diketogulonate reductase-like aldo/keto reductase
LATKFSVDHSDRRAVVAACEASLRRLRTSYIDLYQMHWPSPAIPFEETAAGLRELVEAGKIRGIGFGNVLPTQLSLLAGITVGLPVWSVQQEYSLIAPLAEAQILPLCATFGLTLIAYAPLGQGRLNHNRMTLLREIAANYDATAAQILLAWAGRNKNVIPIPMSSKAVNLRANAAAAALDLDLADAARLSQEYAPKILDIPVGAITVVKSQSGRMFTNIHAARENLLGLSPSPVELAEEIQREQVVLKPIKVRLRDRKEITNHSSEIRVCERRKAQRRG